MAFAFPCLSYLTLDNTSKVHLCCWKWQNFILFNGQVVFILCVNHSSIDRHLGCFHFLAITHNAINIGVMCVYKLSCLVVPDSSLPHGL